MKLHFLYVHPNIYVHPNTLFSWPRPSGSDSDSDDEAGNSNSQPSAVRSVSAVGHPNAPGGNSGLPPGVARVRAHPMAVNAISTPSPQLSLAEFLQDE